MTLLPQTRLIISWLLSDLKQTLTKNQRLPLRKNKQQTRWLPAKIEIFVKGLWKTWSQTCHCPEITTKQYFLIHFDQTRKLKKFQILIHNHQPTIPRAPLEKKRILQLAKIEIFRE